MDLLKKSLPLILSGAIMIVVGIAGFMHSFGAYGRVGCLLFAGYLLASACCVIVGAGICIQSRSIVKAIDRVDD